VCCLWAQDRAAIAQFVQHRKLPIVDEQLYFLREAQQQIQSLLEQSGQYRIAKVRQAFQDCMTQHCGVFRTQESMRQGLQELQQLQQQYSQVYLNDKGTCWNTEIIEALELRNLIIVGQLILTSALNRQESRGAHFREDYTERDDANFLSTQWLTIHPRGLIYSIERLQLLCLSRKNVSID
jgi:succinate dehydrogenase / fumarate reductase flavoprotein subunit